MVRTSVHMEFIVSMRSWAIRHGSKSFTCLFFNILPIFISILLHLTYPTKTLATTITKSAPWCLRGKLHTICRTRFKRYTILVRDHQAKNKTSGATIQTYLFRCSLLPTRLVVVSKPFPDASPVHPPGLTPTWPSRAR